MTCEAVIVQLVVVYACIVLRVTWVVKVNDTVAYLPVELKAHTLVGAFFIPVDLIAVSVGGIIVFGIEDDVGVV